MAVLLAGTDVQFDDIGQTRYSLGLDCFVVSLFFPALVFLAQHLMPFRRQRGRDARRGNGPA